MRDMPAVAESLQPVAIAVSMVGERSVLCPFFAACDGVVVIDWQLGTRVFYENGGRTQHEMCDLITMSGVRRLVLGFVGAADAAALRKKGVDIRLGSCTCELDDLAACFDELPAA